MRRKRYRWLLVPAAAHLLLVTLGAAGVRLGELGPIGRVLDRYGVLSGANSGYGFFTTHARVQSVLEIDVVDQNGERRETSLGEGKNHEIELRLAHIASEFVDEDEDDPGLRRRLAASLAAWIFARTPSAREVVVRARDFESVGMEEFRNGERPRWTDLYEATFRKNAPDAKEPEHEPGAPR